MKKATLKAVAYLMIWGCLGLAATASATLQNRFEAPPASARPWVFWYWMEACVSREGIQADLEAMKDAGIAGAYLMPIKGPADPPLMDPVKQLSPKWWGMVKFAMEEAERLGLKITLHACDGFAVAGGPWITPELSMQKVVWSQAVVDGDQWISLQLPQPSTVEGYYRDIALYAIPLQGAIEQLAANPKPVVRTSQADVDASFLANQDQEGTFRSREAAWIEYAYPEPFTVRSIQIQPRGTNFGAKHLRVEVSDDGKRYFMVRQLKSPRHGWQDGDAPLTFAIPATRARFFRFSYDPRGTEPGAEDLDPAKWRPSLSVQGIHPSGLPVIDQYEGKSGAVWRISPATSEATVPDFLCVDRSSMLQLGELLMPDGKLEWEAPAGKWLLLRMGHTSTGHTNYTGGGGLGLEVDKFNPQAVALQYDRWFGEAVRQIGPRLAKSTLQGFHVDSWECGSQNWSPTFRDAFIKQHDYDPLDWLPAMAGFPLDDIGTSEAFLRDIRRTINRLLLDSFFGTLKARVEEDGYIFSAESVAPTMLSDGMAHHGIVDLPMGEFWLRSPTHDKPNDILDAVSAGHVYGKPIIQAEAFTQVRMAWDEHPGSVKALGDRNFAQGINRFVFHVFTHNPWLDRFPGMTLDGVGLYFQRDQTWWKAGRAWMDYLARCQALLQAGLPQADIAVYTGDTLPRRAVLPDRLVNVLPGLIGPERVAAVRARLKNSGNPMREMPDGVVSSASMENPADWNDPLRGYAYDSINQDALLRLARVEDGSIVLPGGARYQLLVIPGPRRMAPDGDCLDAETLSKLHQLIGDGATILFEVKPRLQDDLGTGNGGPPPSSILDDLWGPERMVSLGRGRIIRGPWTEDDLSSIGVECALRWQGDESSGLADLAWAQRRLSDGQLFFLSNQSGRKATYEISLRGRGRLPEIWDPVTGEIRESPPWQIHGDRTTIRVAMDASEAFFIVLQEPTESKSGGSPVSPMDEVMRLDGPWTLAFDASRGGPADKLRLESLVDWSKSDDLSVRYYSGTARYQTTFVFEGSIEADIERVLIDLGIVENLGTVTLNGMDCGVAWTEPHRLDVTKALRPGSNILSIELTNTWANRLIGDHLNPDDEPLAWTRAPYRLGDGPLLPAGLLGPVILYQQPLQNR